MSQNAMDVLNGTTRWSVTNTDCIPWLASLPDGSVAHVITDPPYGEHVHSKPWQSKMLTAKGDSPGA